MSESSDSDSEDRNASIDIVNDKRKIVHFPSFYDEYMDFENRPPEKFKDAFAKENWITPDLMHELKACFPKAPHIDDKNCNARSKEALKDAVHRLFPKGRIFASPSQIGQLAEKFGDAWAFRITHSGKQIQCYYAEPTYARRSEGKRSNGQRSTDFSLKVKYKCPFRINYTQLNEKNAVRKRVTSNKEYNKLFKPYYQAKITSVIAEHNCELTTDSHRTAIQNSGSFLIEPDKFTNIILDLRDDMEMKPTRLREKLKFLVPPYVLHRKHFIQNFKLRVMHRLVHNFNNTNITHDECQNLLDPKASAADEITVNDNPLQRINLKEILRRTLSGKSDADIWDTKNYLKRIKEKCPGFDYRIMEDDTTGKPQGVCWMFSEQREALLRFSDIIFLDACKKGYNKPNWPYSAIVVLGNEKNIIPICEGLCLAESMENYAFLLKSCQDIEPRWDKRNINLMFADQGITEKILHIFGISNSCLLHGDRWHLLNKVFPEVFKDCWDDIRHKVTLMIDASTEVEWNKFYTEASNVVIYNPDSNEKLRKIFENPRYYSTWYLLQCEGNRKRQGSVPSEINHASIFSYFGKDSVFSLPKNVERLHHRYDQQLSEEQNKEMKRNDNRRKYTGSEAPPGLKNDFITARTIFSDYAFKNYKRNVSNLLQHRIDDEGTIHVFSSKYSWNERDQCKTYQTYKEGERCPCKNRLAYQWQCAHELTVDGCLVPDKWHTRWLNRDAYREHFPIHKMPNARMNEMQVTYHPEDNRASLDMEETDYTNNMNNDIDPDDQNVDLLSVSKNSNSGSLSGDSDIEADEKSKTHNKITFQEVMTQCENYIRLINGNQEYMQNMLTTLKELTWRAQNGYRTNITFGSIIKETEQNPNSAAKAVLRPSRSKKRLKSRHELCNIPKRIRHSNDDNFVTFNRKTKTCSFCLQNGHQRQNCRTKLSYGVEVAQNATHKMEYTKLLKLANHFVVSHRHESRATIKMSVPKSSKGIIIHEKLLNNALSISLIQRDGKLNDKYKRFPWDMDFVASYITGGVKRTIISNLEIDHSRLSQTDEVPTQPIFSQQSTSSQQDHFPSSLSHATNHHSSLLNGNSLLHSMPQTHVANNLSQTSNFTNLSQESLYQINYNLGLFGLSNEKRLL